MSVAATKPVEDAVPPPERQVSVNGYIDAVTGNRVYGWAWDAQKPDAKVGIRMMAKDKIIGAFVANMPREDLKGSGIGDGAHAFEAAIPEGISAADVKMLAVCPVTAKTVELAARSAAAPAADNGNQDLRNVVETLCKSHGFIHQKLQAITTAIAEVRATAKPKAEKAPSDADQAAPVDFAPLNRLQTLEEATVRLDALIKEQGARIATIHHQPVDPLPKFLAAAAVALSAAALLIALLQ